MVDHISRIAVAAGELGKVCGERPYVANRARLIADSALALRLRMGRLGAVEGAARAYLAARDRSDPAGEAEARRLLDAALAGGDS